MSTPTLDKLQSAVLEPGRPAVLEAAVLPAAQASQLASSLIALDVQARVIDGGRLAGKDDLLRELAAVFHFPPYFGHNWDALIDCLSDMHWLPGRGYVCILLNADAFRAADQATHDTLLEVCADVAERWRTADPTVLFRLVRAARS